MDVSIVGVALKVGMAAGMALGVGISNVGAAIIVALDGCGNRWVWQ